MAHGPDMDDELYLRSQVVKVPIALKISGPPRMVDAPGTFDGW